MEEKTSLFSGIHKHDGTWVKDLPDRVGETIFERFMVYEPPEIRESKNDTFFLSVVIGDKTGRIKLTMWQVPIFDKAKALAMFEVEKVYTLEARVRLYRGQINLSLSYAGKESKLWLCEHSDDESKSDYQFADYCQVPNDWTVVPVQEMIEFVTDVIQNVEHDAYNRILRSLWEDEEWRAQFIKWPAAKWYHHAYYGGLLEHVYEMLQGVNTFIVHYPNLNLDLLRTAIILHDVGKFKEYRVGVQIETVKRAYRIGHMVYILLQVDRLVRKKEIEITEEDLEDLIHLIISHHGEVELGFGSAVSPDLPEAKILYQLDQLSSKTNQEYLKSRREAL
ncbi:HD domain-containing protein [Candidatus Kuenenbacteria bacterium]|nr:HD domain-containing protein [Candidatus Kuenenbacteria bacterium]